MFKKLFGSIVTVVKAFLSPNNLIACSLGSGITSSSKVSSSPDPNRKIVFPVFMLLIAFSIYSFIDTGSITLEVWISLLLSPAALALALNRNAWWDRDNNHAKTLVEEEDIELNSNKEVPKSPSVPSVPITAELVLSYKRNDGCD